MQPRAQGAAIAPPTSYSYGQPDRYYPQNGLANGNPPAPAMGRANAPPGRFYDPRNALVANDLGSTSPNDNVNPGQTTWERNGDFAAISRAASPNRASNSRLEAIAGMPVNDGTRSYSPLDVNNSGIAPRSDVADRYGTRRGYGTNSYATRSSTTGGSEPNTSGSYTLRGMRGSDSRQFDLGERDENAERR